MDQTQGLDFVPLSTRIPTQPLASNLFVLALKLGASFHVYSMNFSQEVEDDSRKLRRKLVASAQQESEDLCGRFAVRGIKPVSEISVSTSQLMIFETVLYYLDRGLGADCIHRRPNSVQMPKNTPRELGLKQSPSGPDFFNRGLTLKDAEVWRRSIVWKGCVIDLPTQNPDPVIHADQASTNSTLRGRLQQKGDKSKKAADRDRHGHMATYGDIRCYRNQIQVWCVCATAELRSRISEFVNPLRDEFAVMGVEVTPPKIITYVPESFELDFEAAKGSQMAIVIISNKLDIGYEQYIKKTASTVWIVPCKIVKFPIPRDHTNSIIAKIALEIQEKIGGQPRLMQPIQAFSNHATVVA